VNTDICLQPIMLSTSPRAVKWFRQGSTTAVLRATYPKEFSWM
jgi:hypothetical protein